METMVRLENAGIGEGAAAAMLGISVNRLRYIKRTPEYHAARIQITHGIIIDHEASLARVKEQRKEILIHMLPPALQIIANELMAPAASLAERKHKVAIAQDVLDREGTFAKISKTEIKPVDHFDFEQADQESIKTIKAITGSAPAGAPGLSTNSALEAAIAGGFGPVAGAASGSHSADAVEANVAFSNSHTLSATDQERALARLEQEALETGVVLAGLTPEED
jgi:hypothetical protein